MPDQTRYADLEALKIFKEEYDIKIDEKLNEKINISQGSENAGKILTIDDSGNIIPGNPEVQKATHSSTADTATNAENAVNAEHATSADSATTAESATKATQDASGNIITDTYETKEDAIAKFDEVEKKSVMLVTMTTGDSENFVVDKTFEEVYSHVANGGTAVLYDAVGVFPMTYLYCASADADNYVMFMNTLVDVSDFETYISYYPQGVFSYGIILSNDNTVSVKKSNFDLLTTEINALNTNSRTVTGAINEVSAKSVMMINMTEVSTLVDNLVSPNYVFDKTFAEIYSHVSNGGMAIVYCYGMVLSLYNVFEDSISFICNDIIKGGDVTIYAGDTPFYGVKQYVVSISSDDEIIFGTTILDFNSTEISNLTTTSQTIIGSINELSSKFTDGTNALILVSPNGTRFNITIGDDGVLKTDEITE